MTDLKIPNLNKKSEKYIFKKRLTLRRKSKRKLLIESFLMTIGSIFIIYITYLIPQKKLIFDNFYVNINKFFSSLVELTNNLYEIFIAIFIIFLFAVAIVLILGVFYRVSKILKRKTKQISYK